MSVEQEKEMVHVVMTIARQIQGDYLFLRAEGAFKKASDADVLVHKLAKEFVDAEGKAKAIKLTTPQGEAVCWCEVGAFTMELQ